jgi:hypothetical protein
MQKAEAEQRRINEAAAKIQHAWRSLKKVRAASETKATNKVSSRGSKSLMNTHVAWDLLTKDLHCVAIAHRGA